MMFKKNVLTFVLLGNIFFINAQIVFQNQATTLGVGITTGTTFLGNGMSLVDYDNDGWDDITLATESTQEVRFFKNVNGSFVEQTLNMASLNHQTKSVTWVDIDNDGDKDFFVTSDTNGNKLFQNNGNLVFQDITLASGIAVTNMFSYGASWGDYNNDSFLDVFISNRSESLPNKLYKNNGDNTFTDVSAQAGISSSGHMSFCSVFFDFNNDGWQDIYISNDKYNYANIMYMNNGNNTFTDYSESSLANISIDAMTTTVGDYNNDGWFDLYVTNTPGGNVLFRNQGNGTFFNATSQSGTSFDSVGWGAVFLDADNNTTLDLYVSGQLDGSVPFLKSAAFYQNLGNQTFQIPTNAGFVGDTSESYSNAVGDINNDGLVDIVVNNSGDNDIFIWKNNTITNNNWLKVNLEGVQSNRDGIGSVIEISINGNKQYRYTHAGEGYMSQNSNTECFGLGNATTIDYIKVTWLSGVVDIINNVNSNQTLNIIEGSTLSIEENTISKIRLVTNPVKDFIIIESTLQIVKQELYTILGKKIVSQNNGNKIDISPYKTGTYLLYVTTNQGLFIKKIIVE